jgi:hypothetical protein
MIQAGVTPGSDYAVAQIIARIQNDVSQLELPRDKDLIPIYAVISKRIVRFIKEQSPKIDAGIEVLMIEQELEHPYDDEWALGGYCDLVYRDRQGQLRLRDHKTGEKAWSKQDAKNSNQLLMYALIIWKMTGEVPVGEISFINTKDQVKPMTYEKAFNRSPVAYSELELKLYEVEIGNLIEDMLKSRPTPYYSQRCGYCAFEVPCFLERKGIDATEIYQQHYIQVPRASQRKHRSFSESVSENHARQDSED